MTWAQFAGPIRGEVGYAHWPQLGTKVWGPLGKEDVCHNFALMVNHICVQQFGQL